MRTPTRPLVVRGLLALSVFATLALPADAAQEEPAPEQEATPEAENVLLVILDDVGRERSGAFSSGPAAAPTPTIDALARRGVCFDAAWATPYCSPTRATILTGRHASRTGVGHTVSPHGPARGLSPDEWTLPKAARDLMGVRSAMVGKWHLAGSPDGRDHARKCGFDRFLGTLANLGKSHEIDAYSTAWTVVDNEVTRPRGYITTVTVDDALESIAWFGEVPWVVVVSFHAARFPLPAPPADLDDRPLGPEESAPAPADRVAPIPSAPPEPLVEAAPEVVEQTAPDPIAEAPSAPQEAAAPEEATTEIVTEAEETTNTAPPASPRPQTRPNRPAPQVAETPAEDAPTEEDTTAAAIAAAVAEAAGQSVPQPNPVPSGPPLSSGERDALRVSVQNCWSVDVGSQSANVTVTVAVSMNRDGTVVNNQVRQVEASGGDARAQQAAFEKARRAILRCQRGGFPLPPEKYDHWQEIEMTFNPEGMRLK